MPLIAFANAMKCFLLMVSATFYFWCLMFSLSVKIRVIPHERAMCSRNSFSLSCGGSLGTLCLTASIILRIEGKRSAAWDEKACFIVRPFRVLFCDKH